MVHPYTFFAKTGFGLILFPFGRISAFWATGQLPAPFSDLPPPFSDLPPPFSDLPPPYLTAGQKNAFF